MKTPKILSIGTATQDVFLRNSDYFCINHVDPQAELENLSLGSKINVNSIDFSVGGGGLNAAISLARQGVDSYFMGVVGRDSSGEKILQKLCSEFVDTSRLEISEKYSTDYSTILLTSSGERTIFSYRGAGLQISSDNLNFSNGEFDWIYVSNLAGRVETLKDIFQKANQAGIKILWNPSKKDLKKIDKIREILNYVDILIANHQEMQLLVCGETSDEILFHCLNFVDIAILTDGQNGVWASDGEVIVRAGLYEDFESVDKTGAGDAFSSGFLGQFSQGKSLKDSVIFASANASSVIQFVGANEGLLYRGVELHGMPIHERRLE